MTTIFIAGSRTIRALHLLVQSRIRNIVEAGFQVVIGDADGVDSLVQAHLNELGHQPVAVYCTSGRPRTNLGSWPIRAIATTARPGTRAYRTAKDLAMAGVADYGLMVWDSESPGTLANVLSLLERGKSCVVYLDKQNEALTVSDVEKLASLIQRMPGSAQAKADRTIGLNDRLERLKRAQRVLPV